MQITNERFLRTSIEQAIVDEMTGRRVMVDQVITSGQELIDDKHSSAEDIEQKINDLNDKWKNLEALLAARMSNLEQRKDFYQVCSSHRDREVCVFVVSVLVVCGGVWERRREKCRGPLQKCGEFSMRNLVPSL